MIPKFIHYCWLSDDVLPNEIQKCIDSWKEKMPDYEIIRWDTRRFDVNSVEYVRQAFLNKKYAFCADYIRMYALYTMGGIYLDSDVMVYKSFNDFLNYTSFSSVEYHYYFTYAHIMNKRERLVGIEAAVVGSEKGQQWTKDVLDYLGNQRFSLKKKDIEKNIMPRVIARVLNRNYGFKYFPVYQLLDNGFVVFPSEVFSSKTDETPVKYSAHLGANSWGKKPPTTRAFCRSCLKKMGLLPLLTRMRGIDKIDER